jgi:hypothetical protein
MDLSFQGSSGRTLPSLCNLWSYGRSTTALDTSPGIKSLSFLGSYSLIGKSTRTQVTAISATLADGSSVQCGVVAQGSTTLATYSAPAGQVLSTAKAMCSLKLGFTKPFFHSLCWTAAPPVYHLLFGTDGGLTYRWVSPPG